MRAHLASDMMMGAGLLALSLFMSRKRRVDRLALAGPGAFSLVTAALPRRRPADR